MENDHFQLSRVFNGLKSPFCFTKRFAGNPAKRGKFNGHEFTKTRDYVSACTVSFGNDSFSWSWRWCKWDSRQKELRRYDLPVKGERTPRSDFESMGLLRCPFAELVQSGLASETQQTILKPPNQPPRLFFCPIKIHSRRDQHPRWIDK